MNHNDIRQSISQSMNIYLGINNRSPTQIWQMVLFVWRWVDTKYLKTFHTNSWQLESQQNAFELWMQRLFKPICLVACTNQYFHNWNLMYEWSFNLLFHLDLCFLYLRLMLTVNARNSQLLSKCVTLTYFAIVYIICIYCWCFLTIVTHLIFQ